MNSYDVGYSIGYFAAQILIICFLALIVYLIIRMIKRIKK